MSGVQTLIGRPVKNRANGINSVRTWGELTYVDPGWPQLHDWDEGSFGAGGSTRSNF